MVTRYQLPQTQRLADRRAIDAVFGGANVVRHPTLILLGRANGLHYPRLVVIVAKKNIKKAVARNRIKRLVRESFRLHQATLVGHDCVVIIKKPLAEETNAGIFRILEKQWQRYIKRYNK